MATVQPGSARLQPSSITMARPIAPSDRITAIDIVRGIALYGVMAINVVTEFRVSIFEQFLRDRINGSWVDRALHSILMIGIDLTITGTPAVAKCMERGVLINCTHDTVIRLLPALNITARQVDEGAVVISDVLREMAQGA